MIKKPTGYDEAIAYTGESQQLPKGKYICKIVRASESEERDRNGNLRRKFVLFFDIAEGEYQDFYKKVYEADKAAGSEAKWKGVFKQNMDDKGVSWFKGIITSIERSNNFTFPWDREENEKTLIDKKFGGIFKRRQFEGRNGERPFKTELWRIRSVAGLADAEVPEDELLLQSTDSGKPSPAVDADGFVKISGGSHDEGVPFL